MILVWSSIIPDRSIGGTSKDLVAASAEALDVSSEQLDFPHLPGNCSGHVPLAQKVAAAAAAWQNVCQWVLLLHTRMEFRRAITAVY